MYLVGIRLMKNKLFINLFNNNNVKQFNLTNLLFPSKFKPLCQKGNTNQRSHGLWNFHNVNKLVHILLIKIVIHPNSGKSFSQRILFKIAISASQIIDSGDVFLRTNL